MKDLMIDWVEEHKGENQDGTWFVMDLDTVGEKQFKTEDELDRFLWDYIVANPEHCLPMP